MKPSGNLVTYHPLRGRPECAIGKIESEKGERGAIPITGIQLVRHAVRVWTIPGSGTQEGPVTGQGAGKPRARRQRRSLRRRNRAWRTESGSRGACSSGAAWGSMTE